MNLRLATSLAAAVAVVLSQSSAEAASPSLPRLVLPRTAEVRVLDVAHRPQPIAAGLLLDVLREENGYYWLGRGWIARTDVVALEDAVPFFTSVIASAPSSYAYVSRARAHLQLGAPHEAEADCRAALKLDASYAPAFTQLGRAQTMQRQPNAALESLERAITLDAHSALAFCYRAQTRQAMGDSGSALADFDRAIELDRHLVTAYFHRAGLHTQRGDEPAALTDLNEVLLWHPSHYLALNNRANLFVRREEWDRAVTDYTAALKVAVKPDILLNRSHALRGLGRLREAISDCNEAIRLSPDSAAALRHRAALLLEAGRAAEADLDLKSADKLAAVRNGT